MPRINILIHIYYHESFQVISPYISALKQYKPFFLFCLNQGSTKTDSLAYTIRNEFPDSVLIFTSNIGKDIGGKLALIDLALRLDIKPDYFILLHDKKSPHTTLGEMWREKLFRIIEPLNIDTVLDTYNTDKNVGIIAAREFIINEYDKDLGTFNCTSNVFLKKLIQEYQLTARNFDFVGGTMFWVRAEIFSTFFSKYPPLEIRATLEKGNVLDHEHGTNTHAWERMLSWIATDQGYKIKGI